MRIEVLITNMPGSGSKDPDIKVTFDSDDEASPNVKIVESAALWAAGKGNLPYGRGYVWSIKDDEGKRDAKGMVSVGLVAMACEFPRSVTDDEEVDAL